MRTSIQLIPGRPRPPVVVLSLTFSSKNPSNSVSPHSFIPALPRAGEVRGSRFEVLFGQPRSVEIGPSRSRPEKPPNRGPQRQETQGQQVKRRQPQRRPPHASRVDLPGQFNPVSQSVTQWVNPSARTLHVMFVIWTSGPALPLQVAKATAPHPALVSCT